MKIKYKWLTALSTIAVASPLVITATSCGKKDYSNLAQTIQNEALQQFYDLCKVYRPTYHTRAICDYIKNLVNEYGLGDSIKEDSYRAIGSSDSSGNLTFEIPATRGSEHLPKIIVQGHMDMVCKSVKGYDWKHGVIPIQEGDKLHSKDYQSTLGADDGIGLATILALAKHRNEYNHGPIQCLITTDEEESPTGASQVSEDWLKAPYLVNIDWETDTDLLTTCAGCQESKFDHSFGADTIFGQTSLNQYKIEISGLQGGHSALEIGKNKLNAVLLMADLLEYVMHAPGGMEDIQLCEILSEGAYTSIPTSVTFVIATTTAKEVIETDCADFAAYSKFTHPIEKGLKITATQITDETEKYKFALSGDDSNRVLEYLTLLPYGPISYDKETGNIETAGNVGGFTGAYSAKPKDAYFCLEKVDKGSQQTQMRLQFAIQGRSSNPDHLGPNPIPIIPEETGYYYYIVNATEHVFKKGTEWNIYDYITPIGWLPPWPYKHSKLWDVLIEAGKENKVPLGKISTLGWSEAGYFAYKNPNMQIASIGCLIKDVHETIETLYISTVKNMAFNLIYLFDNIKSIDQGGN